MTLHQPDPTGASQRNLRDTVAVVTGASRGAGRAIALVLGEVGATVYVTGRSSRARGSTEDLPGTVEDAAEEVSAPAATPTPAAAHGGTDMPDKFPRPGEQHPEEWRRDLNSNALAGANYGHAGPHPEDARTALDYKSVHRRLRDVRDDDLKHIPVMPAGSRPEQGATYIDLAQAESKEFTATGDMEADPGACLVPKSAVDYTLWNRLIGVEDRSAPPPPGEAEVAG